MSEILFRGLYEKTWVYGSFVLVIVDGVKSAQIENADLDEHRVYNVPMDSVGQYIGLRLKEKKVFAGDIVYVAGIGNLEVVFDHTILSFGFKENDGYIHTYHDVIEDVERIVGNIHEQASE